MRSLQVVMLMLCAMLGGLFPARARAGVLPARTVGPLDQAQLSPLASRLLGAGLLRTHRSRRGLPQTMYYTIPRRLRPAAQRRHFALLLAATGADRRRQQSTRRWGAESSIDRRCALLVLRVGRPRCGQPRPQALQERAAAADGGPARASPIPFAPQFAPCGAPTNHPLPKRRPPRRPAVRWFAAILRRCCRAAGLRRASSSRVRTWSAVSKRFRASARAEHGASRTARARPPVM